MSHRLLLMVRLDHPIAQQVQQFTSLFRTGRGLAGKPIPPDRLHSTLFHLGDWPDLPEDLLPLVRRSIPSTIMQPFEVIFDRIVTFGKQPGSRALVLLGGEGLVALHRAIGNVLIGGGLGGFVKKSFTPHVTLLRGSDAVDEETVRPFQWTVREFSLVNSLVGHGKYVELERWQLG